MGQFTCPPPRGARRGLQPAFRAIGSRLPVISSSRDAKPARFVRVERGALVALSIGMTTCPLTILLTGASGYVGDAILGELVRAGHRVLAVSHRRLPRRSDRLDIRRIDLASKNAANDMALLPPFDAAIHAAGAPKFVEKESDAMRRLHVDSTVALARECAARGAQFVHISTAFVCPDAQGCLREGPPGDRSPANAYERTKTVAERMLAELALPGIDIVRPAIVVPDPGDSIDLLRLSPLGAFMAAALRAQGAGGLPGKAEAGLAMTRRRDLAAAVRALVERPSREGLRWWNLCSDPFPTLGGIAKAMQSTDSSLQFHFGEGAARRLEAWRPYLAGERSWSTEASSAALAMLGVQTTSISDQDVARCCARLLDRPVGRLCA
jgi:nucleoside-diphosphate-sugar epimerase